MTITPSPGSRRAQVRIGVVGLRRGRLFARLMARHPDARLVAVCDVRREMMEQVAGVVSDPNLIQCSSFEQLMDTDIDAVVLANDATAHAPLAIAALDAGTHVLSEVPAAATLAESVQLVEAAERSSAVYMMAENYCLHPTTMAMRRRYRSGDLGEFQHGEGEYVHDTEEQWPQITGGQPGHWRNTRTSTFYCTHSLGPILHITGTRVTRVVAMETPNRVGHRYGRLHGDSAVMVCQTSDDATIKSLQSHGGLRREPPSTWLAVYGTLGSVETDRWDRGGLWTYRTRPDGSAGAPERTQPDLRQVADLSGYPELLSEFGGAHGGSDILTSHTFLQAVLGREEVLLDAYRATDMSLPGLLAYRSVHDGNVPYDVPDLRNHHDRERWRHDSWAPFPTTVSPLAACPPCSYPVADVATEIYQRQQRIAAALGYPPVEQM